MRLLFTVIALVAAAPVGAAGQLPQGYRFGVESTLPDSLNESYADGRFTIRISRPSRDEGERVLIETAERLLPNPDSVVAEGERWLDRHGRRGAWPEHFRRAREESGARWWWHRWDSILIPYALSSAAVEHYTGALRELAESPYGEPGAQPSGRFTYRATVTETSGVRLVLLSMEWEYWCGMRCAVSFSHERRVTFDSIGNVLRIEGDGPPDWVVS